MIFIFGGKGFIGSAFARRCEASVRPFAVLDRTNYADFVGARCDLFVNAAGNSRKYLPREAPVEDFERSVRSVRASLVDFKFDTYVLISSADVYPDSSSAAATAEGGEPDVALQSPYGFHKYLAELCVRHAAGEWLIVRGGGFVGPGLKKNAIYDILNGGPLWLDPGSELQYLHTDDAARIVFELVDRGIRNQIFNLCAQGVVSIEQAMQWAGRHVRVQPGSPRLRCELNLEKLSAVLEVPETRPTVRDFILRQIGRQRPAGSADPTHAEGKAEP